MPGRGPVSPCFQALGAVGTAEGACSAPINSRETTPPIWACLAGAGNAQCQTQQYKLLTSGLPFNQL